MSIQTDAIVARGPFSEGKWALETVTLRDLNSDEVLVEMVASGVCHTDIHCGDAIVGSKIPGVLYPRVLGHEGSGYVVKVGSSVDKVKPGDPVFLSFSYCGSCHVCKSGTPSHCVNFFEINFLGNQVFSDDVRGRFFGQSSFARHSIVSDKSVINVASLGLSKASLRIMAPLGCGFQTGSGTVMNVANAGPQDCVVVVGTGGVGLAAIMAAKARKCKVIVGVDRVEKRLSLARSVGATHTINPTGLKGDKLVDSIKEATENLGATVSIDTSGSPSLVATLMDATRFMGKVIQVGTGMPDANVQVNIQDFVISGKQYIGAGQGHARPEEYIPQMIQWWREGKFPVESLVEFYHFSQFKAAIEAMKRGDVVKSVIAWDCGPPLIRIPPSWPRQQ